MLSRSCEKLRARFFKLRRKLNRTTFSTILLGKLLRLPIETVLSVLNKRDPNFSKKKNVWNCLAGCKCRRDPDRLSRALVSRNYSKSGIKGGRRGETWLTTGLRRNSVWLCCYHRWIAPPCLDIASGDPAWALFNPFDADFQRLTRSDSPLAVYSHSTLRRTRPTWNVWPGKEAKKAKRRLKSNLKDRGSSPLRVTKFDFRKK